MMKKKKVKIILQKIKKNLLQKINQKVYILKVKHQKINQVNIQKVMNHIFQKERKEIN